MFGQFLLFVIVLLFILILMVVVSIITTLRKERIANKDYYEKRMKELDGEIFTRQMGGYEFPD